MEYSKSRCSLRGFPVEYAVLGFLVEEPLHGYALRSCIAEGLGPLWHVASSQLYQVLHRLQERDCVSHSAEAPSAGPSKTVYQVTSNGEHAFWNWVQAPVDSMRNVRVEFAAKLYFLRRLKLKAVCTLIDRQLNVLEKIKDLALSERRKGSDDPTLNSVWAMLQTTTIDNFAQWLTVHREQLSTDKEKEV